MGKKVSLTLFSMFLLLAMAVVSVSAQSRTVGVFVGDWFKYGDINVHWSSNFPNATIPDYLKEFNDTEYAIVSILSVVNTNVTVEMTTHYKNGSDEITSGFVDIDTGEGENATMLVISADLNENDTIYTSGMYSTWKINETITRIYPDSVRETNHLNVTMEYDVPPIYQYNSLNYYWDKHTGMLVEMLQNSTQQMGENVTTASMSIRITDSDVWVIPEFSTSTTMMLALAVLTTATILLRRRILRMTIH
jgi:hypothetical protein